MKPLNAPSGSPHTKSCGCTGVRWCARCRDLAFRHLHRLDDPVPIPALVATRPEVSSVGDFVHEGLHLFDVERQAVPTLPSFCGLRIYPDFLSESEAQSLLSEIESTPFQLSQSGKDKQHYGPKVNFNKQKMNPNGFRGLPPYAADLEAKLRKRVASDVKLLAAERSLLEAALARYETTDVFVLRYSPDEMSNLDFHLDDLFAYGELILDISLESDSILTFLRGRTESEVDEALDSRKELICVRVPLPARSLAVLYGPARFRWEHSILAYDIAAQRTSVTMRTLSDSLRDTQEGRVVLERARKRIGVS